MTDAMEEVSYRTRDFNLAPQDYRYPHYVTDRHVIFHLKKEDSGNLRCIRDSNGEPIRSPRRLRDVCVYRTISDWHVLRALVAKQLPSNVYPLLLTEAIYMREAQSIEWLVSIWPLKSLRVYDVIPLEDYLEDDYLTTPFEGCERTCLIDCIVLGLLKLRPQSNLKSVDFTRFDNDRKSCKELSRLPILWMKPSERDVQTVHDQLSQTLAITKDKVQKYLNRITTIYSNVDTDIRHGNKIELVTIVLDMKIAVDDVPIGLCLQHFAPFKFTCNKLWVKPITGVGLPLHHLPLVLDTNRIVQFEYEDPLLPSQEKRVDSLLDALSTLQQLSTLSLPNTLDTAINHEICSRLNPILKSMKQLKRLNLNYCNLKGQLEVLMGDLRQEMIYLSLKDCRLNEDDLFFLVNWRPLAGLCELNLSCNNLEYLDQTVIAMLEKTTRMTCLCIAYCSLPVHSELLIARECKELSYLKVLSIQGYTPYSQDDMMDMLQIGSQIASLQKFLLFPEAYAFPGNNEEERRWNKYIMVKMSYRYLEIRGRADIYLE